MTASFFETFRQHLKDLPEIDKEAAGAAAKRDSQLTKPAGALGRLEDLAVWMSGWQAQHPPQLSSPQVVIFAGNHGVCEQGISAFPAEVTGQMVANFEAGGAAINQLAEAFGAEFSVHALDLDNPTTDFTLAPAMTETECGEALATGWNAVNAEADLLVIGEMGIGNTTVAAAVSAALFGGGGEIWAGPGTGISAEGVAHKAEVIDTALSRHAEILEDPLQILRHLGGREIAASAAAILSARHKRIPVLLDGFVISAAAAILFRTDPSALDHCASAHCSAEPGHEILLKHLQKDPLLSLKMRLGEGTGGALAIGIVKGAIATHNGMSTFADAGVSGEA
ncbi:MAG: nicotinate-nucleotide--dimethylbenzimidazole phosphoribosyltransferase [Proteobacteria bacterium]|nr:nicotinate-nucleotide--dimethylbenzimidazole phosphoribosyltransferase [Pseudomonadota bacterium]